MTYQNKYKENDEIDLFDLFKVGIRKLKIIILIMVVCIVGGVIYSYFQEPEYKSTAVLAVMYDGTANESSTAKYAFSDNITNTFCRFMAENIVLEKVAEFSDYSVAQLKQNLDIQSSYLIINISYKDKNENNSKKILNNIVKTSMSISNSLDDSGEPKYKLLYDNLKVFSYASKPVKVSQNIKNISVFAVIGLAISVLYVFIVYFSQKKFASTTEVQELLEVPVLTSVPYYDFDGGNNRSGKKK